jgi:hypothetical protein
MEDRWFVVWDGGALWLHRSWTGFCIYRVGFAVRGDQVELTEVIVNREPEQYTGTDEGDLTELGALLDIVLGYSAPVESTDKRGVLRRLWRALRRS